MAEQHTINCRDCGHPRQTPRKNTRYCHVCRLLRNLRWAGPRTSECTICDREYAPIGREASRLPLCPSCAHHPSHYFTGTCRLCKGTGTLYHEDVEICLDCLGDPKQRGVVLRALARKQVRRREEEAIAA